MTEIFKTIHDEDPHFMREVFVRKDTMPRVIFGMYRLWSVSFMGNQLWNTLPNHMFKNLLSVSTSKAK